jgi:hypothetical protein
MPKAHRSTVKNVKNIVASMFSVVVSVGFAWVGCNFVFVIDVPRSVLGFGALAVFYAALNVALVSALAPHGYLRDHCCSKYQNTQVLRYSSRYSRLPWTWEYLPLRSG